MLKDPFKFSYLDNQAIVNSIQEIKDLFEGVRFENHELSEEDQTEVIDIIQGFLGQIQDKVQRASHIEESCLEDILIDDDFLENYAFLFNLMDEILQRLILDSKETKLKDNPFLPKLKDIPLERREVLTLPSDDKHLNDEFLTERFAVKPIQEILDEFSINFRTQEDFYEDFERFDSFSSKLRLFKYLGLRFCKITKNPISSSSWFKNFISSEEYTESDNIGFDKHKGVGDHGSYYYKSVNIHDGRPKNCYFKLRNQDRIDSINIENIYKEIYEKLSKLSELSIILDNASDNKKRNFYVYMSDLNNVIDTLILKLLSSPQLKGLYNI
ncbi:hypothetical protein CL656_03160 [bacterium]|nr:hypothetical protein [bacterium]|tara:strand:- start:5643 stop:6623 length:981 start_codon:yes stop_codon:yes gene_type:complete